MRFALASKGFINGDLSYNKQVIIDTLIECAPKTDIVIFGEAFLQGFYGINFDVKNDTQIAISQNDLIISEISTIARQYSTAVSFGFIEKDKTNFYSSQITLDSTGEVIDLYRRISKGWKKPLANTRYCEGTSFQSFSFHTNNIIIGLCGDLWIDENVEKVKALKPDMVFWPVYTDFNPNKWNNQYKYEYAHRAGEICKKVLLVNSYYKGKNESDYAKGGAAFFYEGNISKEVPAGIEAILFGEI